MRAIYGPKFKKNLAKFPKFIQKKADKQIIYLCSNLLHPSLRAKKYKESEGIWQARVDDNVRFYFKIEEDTYILIDIKYHPK
jgi:mRNA-degrading endonuclease RelE of RelBE toxin-antitoxin system